MSNILKTFEVLLFSFIFEIEFDKLNFKT